MRYWNRFLKGDLVSLLTQPVVAGGLRKTINKLGFGLMKVFYSFVMVFSMEQQSSQLYIILRRMDHSIFLTWIIMTRLQPSLKKALLQRKYGVTMMSFIVCFVGLLEKVSFINNCEDNHGVI